MYNHKEIEKKWQDFWDKNKTFKTENPPAINDTPLNKGDLKADIKPKWYSLDMFPYPSGAGLHVGHPEGYTANDILSRYKHAKGYNVLHPMGWDAFGLPAENYAIKTGTHPRITTDQNIKTFKTQTKKLGFSYDWDREIDTTDPSYYKWTQWIFLKLFEHGLAYEQDLPINYCPSCKTGLANEEVLNDFTCERCGTKVEKKKIRQWVLAITKYADRLLADVDKLDWPEGIKDMQRNWIGKSEGCEFEMKKDGNGENVIILHGRQRENRNLESGYQNTRHWIPWLKKELEEKGFNVFAPCIENDWEVKYEDWKKEIDKLNDYINENTTLIGTSAGGAFWVRWLGENKKKIKKLILIAPVKTIDVNHDNGYDSKNGFWDFDIDESIKERVGKITIFISNDKEFIIQDSYNYANILDAKIIALENRGHFTIKDNSINIKIPEVIEEMVNSIKVYTTRIDTVFGMTYAVLAPDHPQVLDFITPGQKKICLDYIDNSKKKSDQDRTADNKEKTGVFTGSYVINPYNNEKVPLWIADYVLGNYGTGAVMAVPAHDERDFEFAKKYDLEIKQSIANNTIYTGISAPKEGVDKLYKKTVDIILENDKGEVLIQIEKEGNINHIHFVGGGIDEGEEEIDAVKRELIEETGYTDFEIIGDVKLSYSRALGYRHTKNRNQDCVGRCFYIKLKSDIKIASEVEEGKHTIKWVEKDKVESMITWIGHSKLWNLFYNGEKAYTEDGILVNSGEFNGLTSEEARQKLSEYAEQNGFGTKKVNYKLRDWLYSRQRYWGEPIPFIHLEEKDVLNLPKENNAEAWVKNSDTLMIGNKEFSKIYDGLYGKIVCDYNLPLKLPEVANYEPAGDGNSPLVKVTDFVNVKLANNLSGKRETNTMPQWGGSCWYYLRFMDPKNDKELVNPEVEKYWGQVDSYVGGAEHAVLHLLYARFWHKFLFDIKVVSSDEPFYRLRNQGLILAHAFQRKNGGLLANDLVEEKNGKYYEIVNGEEVNRIISKMSKSLKNVINPDDIVEEYGADSLRLYEMYMAEFKDAAPWDSKGIVGVRRFLEKSERLFTSEAKFSTENDNHTMKLLHKTIKKVEEDIENYKFNTAIAALMILVNNGLPKDNKLQTEWKNVFIRLLHPFAPHLSEELWERTGEKKSVFTSKWPEYDKNLIIDDTITIGVQVLGKLRGEIEIGVDEDEKAVLEKAKNNENVKKWLEGKIIVKEIYVKGKIVNIVVR